MQELLGQITRRSADWTDYDLPVQIVCEPTCTYLYTGSRVMGIAYGDVLLRQDGRVDIGTVRYDNLLSFALLNPDYWYLLSGGTWLGHTTYTNVRQWPGMIAWDWDDGDTNTVMTCQLANMGFGD